MRVHRSYGRLPDEARGAAVAIGNFDGVHRGHRAVIGAALEHAQRLGAPLGVVTFEPHPREVLAPDAAPARLTPLRAKAVLLGDLGVDRLYVLPFGDRLMRLPPDGFVNDVLVDALGVVHAVTGEDFRFGHRRSGTGADLARLGEAAGFGVTTLSLLAENGVACSSTLIRQALRDGEVARARAMLGHDYHVEGVVVPGDRRGHEIGFPTANIRPLHRRALLPAPGVYAVRAGLRGDGAPVWHNAVANLGFRPTFDGRELRLEVHLFDFDQSLYGRRLCVAFVERLRGEKTFDGIAALTAQIGRDCAQARQLLAADCGSS